VDCTVTDPEHGPACAFVTGVFANDLEADARCSDCRGELGDTYHHLPTDPPDDANPDDVWCKIVCAACAFEGS
jgi:hypothetical protein